MKLLQTLPNRRRRKSIWSEAELQAWQLPKPLTVSEWADKYRILDPMSSAEPGQWITDRTPYIRGILDCYTDPEIEDITIMASTQVGKTECGLNMLGYLIDEDPGPTMWVSARQEDAQAMASDRIIPMIRLSTSLAGHRNLNPDDLTKKGITLDRMKIYFGWSNSAASLSSKPVKNLFMDETDKYPKFSGKEADPVKLATERTRTFWNRKIVKMSTPTTRDGLIFREFQKTDQRRYYVPCPHCGEYQILINSQIKFPAEERNPEKIKSFRMAWYECLFCKGRIEDRQKHKMLLAGSWVPEGCEINRMGQITGDVPNTRSRGFWINALYSPWLSFSEIAAEFLRCQENVQELMNFTNSWLAEIWEEKIEEPKEERIIQLIGEYNEGKVPAAAMVLTATIDVQLDYFIGVIRAWGVGWRSWLVRSFRAETWADIEGIVLKTAYLRSDGGKMNVFMAGIDSGYRTDEVYEFCSLNREICRPLKGDDKLTNQPFTVSRIERNFRTGSTIEGGISLWRFNANFYKDKLSRLMSAAPGDPSRWEIFPDPSTDYLKQMCSEHKIIKRDKRRAVQQYVWEKKTHSTPNHFWDAEVMAAVVADMVGVSNLRGDDQEPAVYNPEPRSAEKSWLNKREGWLKR